MHVCMFVWLVNKSIDFLMIYWFTSDRIWKDPRVFIYSQYVLHFALLIQWKIKLYLKNKFTANL